jgi:tetratricopeptide (TPR) repeat protein
VKAFFLGGDRAGQCGFHDRRPAATPYFLNIREFFRVSRCVVARLNPLARKLPQPTRPHLISCIAWFVFRGWGDNVSDSSKANVSLCMIVRNEQDQLADCLAPIADLFDQIVIVDTGSHDNTRQVAARFTPHVFGFPWCDDFAAARNETLRHATGDWIFWLDADDRLTPENIARLKTLLATLDATPRAWLMNTVCPARYECEGANLITHPRLFRRHPDLRWHGRVHEQLRPEPDQLAFELLWSDVQILHIGYTEGAAYQRKLQRNVRLLLMDYAVDPDNVSTLIHLGLSYFHLGRFELARPHLERVLTLAAAPGDHLRQVYGSLASMALAEGKADEALERIDQALALFPGGEYLLLLRAESLYDLDRYAEAKTTLARIIDAPDGPQYRGGVPSHIKDKLAPRKLADVLRLQQQYAAAEAIARSIVTRFADDTLSWHTLGRVYLDWGQRIKLLRVVERLRACPQGELFASLLLATWHLQQRDPGPAGPLIDRLIAEAPQMPMLRILRAEWLAQTNAPIDDRIHACRDILRLQPGHVEARRLLETLQAVQHQVAASPARAFSTTVVLGEGITISGSAA